MKKVYLLIILIAFFKLTCFGLQSDTLKKASAVKVNDTTRKTSSDGNLFLKNTPLQVSSDSLQIASAHRFIDSIKIAMTNHISDNQKITASLPDTDRPKYATKKTVEVPDGYYDSAPAVIALAEHFKTVTSMVQLDSLRAFMLIEQARQAELQRMILKNEQLKIVQLLKINNLDSLKQQLKVTSSDTLRATLYSRIATKYLDYDTISNKDKKYFYQNQALSYTLLAIREYSTYNDSLGLRASYDNLAKVYQAQRKFTQAKWFILQSNTLSRARNDVPNIIASLLTLASIKSSIKDYDLAMSDLNEALQLSITHHTPKTELDVLKNYAYLYNQLKDYPKETIILKRRDSLVDSMRRSDEALLAKEALQKKRMELLQNKKKTAYFQYQEALQNQLSGKNGIIIILTAVIVLIILAVFIMSKTKSIKKRSKSATKRTKTSLKPR